MKNNYLNLRFVLTAIMSLSIVMIWANTLKLSNNDPVTTYVLTWSDEFDGTTLDPDNWFHQTLLPDGSNWYNGEVQHYTDEIANSIVSNGTLKIKAIKESYTDQGVTKEYTSARLNSKHAFTYGRVDVRAKLPNEAGTWPAIWSLGQSINEPGGYWNSEYGTTSWPTIGEIDIMEQFSDKQTVTSALHTTQSSGSTENKGAMALSSSTTSFHEYSMIWNEDEIQFLVDDTEYYTYNPETKYGSKTSDNWPYTDPQYLLLNVAMGGVGGSIDPNFTSAEMEIDYVRVYEAAEANEESIPTIDFETGGVGAGFTWTTFENDDNPVLEIVSNPDATGANTSSTVAKFTARAAGQSYAGLESAHGDFGPITFDASNSSVKMMVYKTEISDVGLKFVENAGEAAGEIKVANTLVNQWEELTFDLSGLIGTGITQIDDQIVIFPDFQSRAQENIVYFDNISFHAQSTSGGEGSTITATSGNASAPLAIDGNGGTRWESEHGIDDVTLTYGLGSSIDITTVQIDWEGASAADYELLGSTDGTTWVSIEAFTGLSGARSDVIDVNSTYSHLQIHCTVRSLPYGYSIYEIIINPGQTGGATEPTVSAPTPTHAGENVISIFSDAYTDVAISELNPFWGQSGTLTVETVDGGDVWKYANLNYQGTQLAGNNDVSDMEYLHVDMWTADADLVEITPINASGDPAEYLLPLTTITTGIWKSYDIPLTDFTSQGMALNEVHQLKVDAQKGTTGVTVYLDNVYFYKSGGGNGGSGVATIDFEMGGVGAGFTWTTFENDDNPVLEIVSNPDATGANTSSTVAKFTARAAGQSYAGLESAHGDFGPITFDASNSTVKMMVYKTEISDVGLKFVENAGEAAGEIKVANTLVNQWEELTFDLSSLIGTGITQIDDQIVIFPDFQSRAQENIVYFDNISFQASDPAGPSVVDYCETEVKHLGVEAEVGSAMKLTIANVDAQSMIVTIESSNEDPVDDLVVNNGSGPITGSPTVSDIDNSVAGKLSRTLTWTGTAPVEIELNVLWSKVGNGEGLYQLIPGADNTLVSFDAICVAPGSELLVNGDFEDGTTAWSGNALDVRTESENSYNFAEVLTVAANASDVNISNVVEIVQGKTYTLSFNASSDRDRTILAGIGLNEDPWTNISETANLTTTDQLFSFVLEATDFGSANSRVLFDMGADVGVVVIDNVSLVEGGTVVPDPPVVDLPITFDDAIDYELADFGGNGSSIVADPTDATNKVVTVLKGSNGAPSEVWAGTTVANELGFINAIPFANGDTKMNIRVYTPAVGTPILLKVEDVNDGTKSVEVEVQSTEANSWHTLTFDFSNHAANTSALDLSTSYTKASVFFNFGTAESGENTYYFDDLKFGEAGVDPLSTDASLSEITIDNVAISFFDPATLNYDWTLSAGTSVIPTVEVTSTDPNATVVPTQATSPDGTASILVTAEDGTTTKTYTVNFSVSPLSTELLQNVKVYGTGSNVIHSEVSNKFIGSRMNVYGMDGRIIGSQILSAKTNELRVKSNGLSIIRIQNGRDTVSFKIWVD